MLWVATIAGVLVEGEGVFGGRVAGTAAKHLGRLFCDRKQRSGEFRELQQGQERAEKEMGSQEEGRGDMVAIYR